MDVSVASPSPTSGSALSGRPELAGDPWTVEFGAQVAQNVEFAPTQRVDQGLSRRVVRGIESLSRRDLGGGAGLLMGTLRGGVQAAQERLVGVGAGERCQHRGEAAPFLGEHLHVAGVAGQGYGAFE